jgi:hypothetical protein
MCWDPLGIAWLEVLQDSCSCMQRAEGALSCCVLVLAQLLLLLLLLLLFLQHAAEVALLL